MITDSAAIVMFAIRSGIRLGQQVRKSYIDATRRRELVLPLPRFFGEIDSNDEAQWFHSGDGQRYLDQSKSLKVLIVKFGNNQPLEEPERKQVHEFYGEFRSLFLAEQKQLPPVTENGTAQDFPVDEVIAWVTV